MSGKAPARCLDITRLISRAGRGALTGVDRVELAYLDWLLSGSGPVLAIARTRLGYVLVGRAGMVALAACLRGTVDWPRADPIARLLRRGDPGRARAEVLVRRHARARATPWGLARMLRRHLPRGAQYFNTGHSNLTARMLGAMRAVPDGQSAVLIHDVIPLEHPEWTRPGVPETFAAKLRRVAALADLVIYNSVDTRQRAEAQMRALGRVPPGVVAHLGVDVAHPDAGALPTGLPPPVPYFMALGTIEPRKNHALLLDVWEGLITNPPPGPIPTLIVAGRRGWRNAAVFARLDRARANGSPIIERADLSDGALAALMAGAAALLQPSRAEGYGLPPLEAAALGTPVICADLRVYRETMGGFPVYLNADDPYPWREAILQRAQAQIDATKAGAQDRAGRDVPTWQAHFNTVLSAFG